MGHRSSFRWLVDFSYRYEVLGEVVEISQPLCYYNRFRGYCQVPTMWWLWWILAGEEVLGSEGKFQLGVAGEVMWARVSEGVAGEVVMMRVLELYIEELV